jgi:cyclic beta-1,2-glucan synthetase
MTFTQPIAHVLSNAGPGGGRLSVVLAGSGAGYTQWNGSAVTRWREDLTRQPWATHLLLRDAEGVVSDLAQGWMNGGGPMRFADGVASLDHRLATLDARLDVLVASGHDAERRRVRLTNRGDAPWRGTLTSYAELVLGSAGADASHPAFSKMFVQTSRLDAHGVTLGATRRPRTTSDPSIHAVQTIVRDGNVVAGLSGDTDRAHFLGRCRELDRAQAMTHGDTLDGRFGTVLDPVFALRVPIDLAPGATITLDLWTALGETQDAALKTLDAVCALDDAALREGARHDDDARRAALGLDAARAAMLDTLLAPVLHADTRWRADTDVLHAAHGGQPVLWAHGISGDRALLLAYIASAADIERAAPLRQAQRLWRIAGLAVDVALLDVSRGESAVASAIGREVDAQRDAMKADDTRLGQGAALPKAEIFALDDAALDDTYRTGVAAFARVALAAGKPLAPRPGDQHAAVATPLPAARTPRSCRPFRFTPVDAGKLAFAQPHGGFDLAEREYAIALDAAGPTPMPWSNVIAQPDFGCLVTAEGGGYAWATNSQQDTLTPWPNDPVSDTPHDVLYLTDLDGGQSWTPTLRPIHVDGARYAAHHGTGYSRFQTGAHGLDCELLVFVPAQSRMKISRLRLCNPGDTVRRLSVTAYVEWSLGANGSTPQPFVVTALDASGALTARNAWRQDFDRRVAFLDLGGAQQSTSGDRAAFLGAFGTPEDPVALRMLAPLDGRVGAGLDPCGALQTVIMLPPGQAVELVAALGEADDADALPGMIAQARELDLDAAWQAVRAQWNELFDAVQVKTPDPLLDVMLNQWLLYQALSCRVWGRTAYYQASGAYGFRDQLQDVMALCLGRPDVVRGHLLRAAGRQFIEGDVQHWWLPPGGQGIRTRIADDRAWLPYVLAHYIDVTGDIALLDESVPFLDGPVLKDDQSDAFFAPGTSDKTASMYEHAALALDTGLTCGARGLPLFGTGDWNDGMNAVGAGGKGESTWMGWFLLAAIDAFLPSAIRRGDQARVVRWREWSVVQRAALERAWDGHWYLRGYYDDGTPLGSQTSDECQIDAIAQSWSAMGNGNNEGHQCEAMDAVARLLVDPKARVHRLFTPPFDRTTRNPGYIKGYPPGLRENGGQYTHGAAWSAFAWAKLGDGERTGMLLKLLGPISHSDDAQKIARYQVEPYVACADVYSVAPLDGRGGWTWYSGSAGWLYRAGLEALLGLRPHGDRLEIDPCIPSVWPGFTLTWQRKGEGAQRTRYEITVENPDGVCCGVVKIEVDGQTIEPDGGRARIAIHTDGACHCVRVVMGAHSERLSRPAPSALLFG